MRNQTEARAYIDDDLLSLLRLHRLDCTDVDPASQLAHLIDPQLVSIAKQSLTALFFCLCILDCVQANRLLN